MTVGCGEKNVYAPPPTPKVTVIQPTLRLVTDYLEFTGNTQAIQTAMLRARIQGVLERVYFKDGDMVKKGQLLFLIQPNTYQAQLESAEAEVMRQKAAVEHARTEFARYTNLVQQKAAARSDLENWRFQLQSAQGALKAAQAQVELTKLNLSYTKVTAPFSGRIGRRLQDPGNLVGAGEYTSLAEINQIDPIYVYFTISESDLLRVMGKSGRSPLETEKIKVPLYLGLENEEGYPHKGYLDFAAISMTPTTGTLQLRGIFSNPDGKIIPGMFARLRGAIVGKPKEDLLVPAVALGYDQQGNFVLVVDENNIVQRRSVKLGISVGDLRVVEEGLTANDWILTSGLLQAIPGKPVIPVKQEPKSVPEQENSKPKTALEPEKSKSATSEEKKAGREDKPKEKKAKPGRANQ
ncbi:MAG TPA: efflux RND transporter periplasmic adaptor subunit [Thermodesulfobacteriota bacterium]|nr:efflux RND transporter periplasmic adaptor subunit [Thermodesulfobacteriota bacterium]